MWHSGPLLVGPRQIMWLKGFKILRGAIACENQERFKCYYFNQNCLLRGWAVCHLSVDEEVRYPGWETMWTWRRRNWKGLRPSRKELKVRRHPTSMIPWRSGWIAWVDRGWVGRVGKGGGRSCGKGGRGVGEGKGEPWTLHNSLWPARGQGAGREHLRDIVGKSGNPETKNGTLGSTRLKEKVLGNLEKCSGSQKKNHTSNYAENTKD